MRDRLILLGTKGGPSVWGCAPTPSSSVLVSAGVANVIDAGFGATMKLLAAGIPLNSIRRIFITHHHSDHNLDLGPMLYTAWANGLLTEIDTYGPDGLINHVHHFWEANRFDIETRLADEGGSDPRRMVHMHEYGAGNVLEEANIKVTALRNHHPPIQESYALRFEVSGKVIVFSGDTAYFPGLADFARNADYLVHEAMYGPAIEALADRFSTSSKLLRHLKASHTVAEDVGRIASAAGIRRLC